jgi:hypothetical protein
MNRYEKYLDEKQRRRMILVGDLMTLVAILIGSVVLAVWISYNMGFRTGERLGVDRCRVLINTWADLRTDAKEEYRAEHAKHR